MTNTRSTLLLLPFLALAASACGGGGTNDGGAVTCFGTSITANEVNNYAFSSTLTFPPIAVAPKTELTFDWGGVTKDFVGHTIDPKADLNTILVMLWKLSLADLQTKLNADSLQQRDLVTLPPLSLTTDGSTTTAKLFDFTNSGAPDNATILSYLDADAYPPANYTYTLMATKGSTLGQGTKMIQSFQVDPNSTNTKVTMTSDSTKLKYTADLHSLTATGIPAGQAAITLDWGNMITNALGSPFTTSSITAALIGHYTQTPTELETQFLDLDLIATDLYRANIDSGTVVDFSSMKTDSGTSFAGIDNTGTWVVALECGTCKNPAPWYLSVLKVCTPK